MRAFAVGIAASALIGGTPHAWRSFHADGVTVRYPPGWHGTNQRLTAVTSPRQAFVVTSYRLPRQTMADNCDPTSTLAAMPAGGALIFAWEYPRHATGLKSFPPRPMRFQLGAFGNPECFGARTAIVAFRQAGRFFEINVVLGWRATAATRATALRILDSLVVNPPARPAREVSTSGVRLVVPKGWHGAVARAARCDPERLIVVSSGRIRFGSEGSLEAPREGDVLVVLLEDRLRKDRPLGNLRKPAHFSVTWNRLVRVQGDCGLPNAAAFMRYFEVDSRYLGFLIYPGTPVALRRRAETLAVMDSLRVR